MILRSNSQFYKGLRVVWAELPWLLLFRSDIGTPVSHSSPFSPGAAHTGHRTEKTKYLQVMPKRGAKVTLDSPDEEAWFFFFQLLCHLRTLLLHPFLSVWGPETLGQAAS